jgi:SAM-dependent methyltransferase
MAEESGWEGVGVDLNPKAIEYAKHCLGVNALLGDIRDNCFPDGSFNIVTLWNVLDHVPDPLNLLLEVHRVLKDDGYVFIRIPNGAWQYLNFRMANFLGRLGWGKVFDERPFVTFVFHTTSLSRSTLRLLIEHAGFVSLSIKNSKPTQGDPYLGLGSGGELLLMLIKLTVHGLAQSAYLLSGGRWLVGPSLEAWGRRGKNDRVKA